jgi:phosphatidylserine decarboxylase
VLGGPVTVTGLNPYFQARPLEWKKTLKLLEDQSVNMGKEYDDPASKVHIQPFIESFKLQDGLEELERPDPASYLCFNDFFSRALRSDARPIAEADNPNIVSSPADSRLTAFSTIDLPTKYWIKGYGFTVA